MKKSFSVMLAMLIAFSFTLPAMAAENQVISTVPASFDFDYDIQIALEFPDGVDADTAVVLALLGGNQFAVTGHGTVISDTYALFLYIEMALSGVMANTPFRLWLDADFSDVDDLTFYFILELPPLISALMGTPQLQFIYMNGAEFFGELQYHLDAAIVQISDEELMEIQMQTESAFLEIIETIIEAIQLEYDLGYTLDDNGYFTQLTSSMQMHIDDDVSNFAMRVDTILDITNINTAVRIPMPFIESNNGLNLTHIIFPQ